MANATTTNKENKMTTFKVTFIHPITGKEATVLDVPAKKMNADRSAYILNSIYDSCEIVNVCETSAKYHEAKNAYFEKFRTAAE